MDGTWWVRGWYVDGTWMVRGWYVVGTWLVRGFDPKLDKKGPMRIILMFVISMHASPTCETKLFIVSDKKSFVVGASSVYKFSGELEGFVLSA